MPLTMAETGWPLIPRELLPAPVPVASRTRRPLSHATPGGRQLPIFGAETTDSSPLDLAGLLVGPGRLDKMGGTARVSIGVHDAWRVHVLAAELLTRGLVVHWRPFDEPETEVRELQVTATPEEPDLEATEGEDDPPEMIAESAEAATDASAVEDEDDGPRFEVRTAYSSRLDALARGWPAAADGLFLSGPRLRLWVAAAGTAGPGGFTLDLNDEVEPEMIVAALRRAGLDGSLSDRGRHYRITRRRPLLRLAELVGERPASAPAEVWPGGAGA
ncbi:hypothetical protein [Actinoplanes sp. NBRC 103695]|uniref:hypothetical protein n=1 Tax=Actinoplanes sp. NBRC 103695 TaxID=3032202 RepID=UPI0024A566BB|nr:hypothetical protein [Actinoplanes sp. NBRC 103695]GLY98209.1 hypothetical protein Acsp02_54630 [Actinoplanes sp. NBRC 103695]